ncbi:C-type natriuretic peptide [Cebus imitator]|uniref:C-type natriuretic peptide n=1 Tax=Cebus imitator TaxID=2715852 RepID=A0A2K5R8T5_CEBIM|nr:C-type natriuretic peptide [Cebus imitator]
MHLSQLLACALLLLTLLSLRPSEAKPGAQPKVPRTPPGEELAEPQAAGGCQKKGDKAPGGGGANLKGDRSRLLRDLRADTKSRAAWGRHVQEHPNARKHKASNKKNLSKGCFGLKLDRIGSMSGLGC